MRDYFLAVDIGASSGRLILGYLEKGRLMLEEIHRFDNGIDEKTDTCAGIQIIFSAKY